MKQTLSGLLHIGFAVERSNSLFPEKKATVDAEIQPRDQSHKIRIEEKKRLPSGE